MYKQAESGLVGLVEEQQRDIDYFIPVGFVLVSLVSITLSTRLGTPFLLAIPVVIWFVAVPLWDRKDNRYLRERTTSGSRARSMGFVQSELIATTAGLAILGMLLLIATSTQSTVALIGLSVTGGLLLSMAANPALQFINGEYRLSG